MKCPSCQATDNNPYIDQHGAEMRACGRCMIQWRVRDPFGNAPKFSTDDSILVREDGGRVIAQVPPPQIEVPSHIQKLYDRCCELEEHVASHDLKEFERCSICEENGEARRADIAYENAAIAWVNGLCGQKRPKTGCIHSAVTCPHCEVE